MKKLVVLGMAVVAVAIVAVWAWRGRTVAAHSGTEEADSPSAVVVDGAEGAKARPLAEVGSGALADRQVSPEGDGQSPVDGSEDLSQTEEERREAEEEKLVEAFDLLTDRWMETSAKGVSMSDVDEFVRSFRKIPKGRQDECIHRALNLVPDGNVMLLAGVLMDKTLDKEIVETVFNDILNRDEEVKKPILQEIFKDKSHPCWADTAWILDVTGELPKKK